LYRQFGGANFSQNEGEVETTAFAHVQRFLQIYPREILLNEESQWDSISALVQEITFFFDWLSYGDSEGAWCCLENFFACTAPHVRHNETKPHERVAQARAARRPSED
jgi:hypothetical protein